MATLTIRSLSESTKRALKARAAGNDRSMKPKPGTSCKQRSPRTRTSSPAGSTVPPSSVVISRRQTDPLRVGSTSTDDRRRHERPVRTTAPTAQPARRGMARPECDRTCGHHDNDRRVALRRTKASRRTSSAKSGCRYFRDGDPCRSTHPRLQHCSGRTICRTTGRRGSSRDQHLCRRPTIAAICHVSDCAIATRNADDFRGSGLTIINPFENA